MNLDHLKYFHDAATLESLSAAARLNRVTQSAVSQAILKVERHFGTKLLTHKRNQFELTLAGKAALRESQKVFDSVEAMKKNVAQSANAPLSGEITLAASYSVAITLLPSKLSLFSKLHPEVKIKLRLGNSEVVRRWLLEREVKIGVVVDEVKDDRFKARKVASGQFGLYEAIGGRSDWLSQGIFVTRQDRPEVQKLRREFLKRTGNELPIKMEITSWEVMKEFIAAGAGAGLCPDYVMTSALARRQVRPIASSGLKQNYTVTALYLAARPLPNDAQALLKLFD